MLPSAVYGSSLAWAKNIGVDPTKWKGVQRDGSPMVVADLESTTAVNAAIGILGAVMGLIHVMENLSDPSRLGAGIAVAFVATIYGVGSANLIFLPIAKKLLAHVSRLTLMREMYVDGLIGIASGDNPRIIESRLQGYLV